jgi:hypothetical protein
LGLIPVLISPFQYWGYGQAPTVKGPLSRWAYPASQSFNDISWHESKENDEEMKRIIEEEKTRGKGLFGYSSGNSRNRTRSKVFIRYVE